ncbi:MAG: 16S rRNA (cytosine(1402)-N(4))-methyltransferase RsmH [Solobacterium sp.]|nr:16S rRNA (cytosine(1402)-N(4))-methyltransferase RsmH [Solobacterium sp.]
MEHESVLLPETIELLDVKPEGIYVDATLGRGGHTRALAEKLTTGHLYSFDKDAEAIAESQENLADLADRITLIHADFRDLRQELEARGVEAVDGVMMDLGVSSPQFDDPERGFSYRFDARLDMRMDQEQKLTAYDVINTYGEGELASVFRRYGEERYAGPIARTIVRQREKAPVETTFQLVELIRSALPAKVLNKKGHPAKQVFQALRIEVNDELGALEEGLQQACSILKPGGRCAVITFHSLEDRIVKTIFKELTTAPFVEPRLPVKASQMEQASFTAVTRKPVTAGSEELARNRRAHSAKLRAVERIR